jgi:hypothetical protein
LARANKDSIRLNYNRGGYFSLNNGIFIHNDGNEYDMSDQPLHIDQIDED